TNLEVTQYQGSDAESYLNLHVRDTANPGATPATGGVSIQRGELGDFVAYTVNDGAGGRVTLTHEQLIDQYAAHGFVYRGLERADTLRGTQYADTLFGAGGKDTLFGNGGD